LKELKSVFWPLLSKLFPGIYFDFKETLPKAKNLDAPLLYVGVRSGNMVSDEMLEFLKSYATSEHNFPIIGLQVSPTLTVKDERSDMFDHITPKLFKTRLNRSSTSPLYYRAISMDVVYNDASRSKVLFGKNAAVAFIALSHWLAYVCKAPDAFIPRSKDLMTNPMWHPQNFDLLRRFRVAYYKTTDDDSEPPAAPSSDEYYEPVYDMSTWFGATPLYSDAGARPMRKAFVMPPQQQRAYDLAVADLAQKEIRTRRSTLSDDFAQNSSKRSERSDGPSSSEEPSEKMLRIQSEIARLSTLIGDLMT
jgi:hypothetical protein